MAQTTSAKKGWLTQMMMNGARATIGVTCRITAHGWMAARNSRLAAMATASATPMAVAAARAAKVTLSVESSAASSTAWSSM